MILQNTSQNASKTYKVFLLTIFGKGTPNKIVDMVAIVKLLLFIIYQTSFTYFDNCLVIYRFIFLLNVKINAIHKNTIPTKLILPKNLDGFS